MILEFARDLSRLSVHAQGVELAQVMGRDRDADGGRVATWPDDRTEHVADIDAPVLVTDNHRIAGFPSTVRDTLFALYGSPRRVTRFGPTAIDFEQRRYPGVWGPSIDTVLFCRALDRLDLGDVRRAAEAGAGSGFLSMHLLQTASELESMRLVDIDDDAVRCGRDHIDDPRAAFFVGDARDVLSAGGFDLVVCNPPYIPRPQSIEDNPYEGVGLLAWLIEHAREVLSDGGRIVTNVSSLSRSLFDPLVARAGVTVDTVDGMTVPLKVYNVLNNATWLDFLIERHGLARHRRDGYEFWQELAVVELRPA